MTIWIIVSWVLVALMTAGNIFVFLKLKKAGDQMMKAAFPGAKGMNDAMAQAQQMMASMQRSGKMNPQMKMAMEMMNQLQKGKR